jgi:hypothetical protein
MSDDPLMTCAKAPCKSCPYRRDVPSGVWASEEYDKLARYDGDIPEQLDQDAIALFLCHQQDGRLCAGWVAAHGADNLLAMRLHHHEIEPSVWDYQSPVPVFDTGREARDHGQRDINAPGEAADRAISRLLRKAGRT